MFMFFYSDYLFSVYVVLECRIFTLINSFLHFFIVISLLQFSACIQILGITTLALNQNRECDLTQWIALPVVNGNYPKMHMSFP